MKDCVLPDAIRALDPETRVAGRIFTCLRLFSIDIPAHPTWEQVQVEYEKTWQNLGKRSIESLIDLPIMTDPQLHAAMQLLSVLTPPPTLPTFTYFPCSSAAW
jgi:predicted ATPase